MSKASAWAMQYRDSRWQKKRLEIMERDKWTCQSCAASGEGVTLNVHHAYYEAGKAPWEYPNQSLVTWCEDCHKARHWMMKQMQEELVRSPIMAAKGALALSLNYPEVLEYIGAADANRRLPTDPDVLILVIRALCDARCSGVDDYISATADGATPEGGVV